MPVFSETRIMISIVKSIFISGYNGKCNSQKCELPRLFKSARGDYPFSLN